MKLIVGLGNPGRVYIDAKHNLGSSTVKSLAKHKKIVLRKDSQTLCLCSKAALEGQPVILAIPLLFMNLSGRAVRALVKKYKIDLENLLVVCDDLDLAFGRLKVKPEGSAAGHRGLKSIIGALGSEKFARLRMGIGRPAKEKDIEVTDYVLSAFNAEQKRQLPDFIKEACACCQAWVTQGVTKSMSLFNRRSIR